MKEKNKKIKKTKQDRWFLPTNIIFLILIILSIIFSAFDYIYNLIPWCDDTSEIIGVITQSITAISNLVVSIIGISISLQNEEYFGIKVSKLYSLRKNKHYSVLQIIIISIILCVINSVCYMCNMFVAVITVSIISVVFSIVVTYLEVPLMSKNEKAIIKILKSNQLFNYVSKTEPSKELKDAIKFLLYNKNLKYTFNELKCDDEEYNKHLFFTLLAYQQDIAFNLDNITSKQNLYEISDSLLENVFDVLLNVFDFDDNFFNEIVKNKHLLTRVLFRLEEITGIQKKLQEKISQLCQLLIFSKQMKSTDTNLLASVIITLVSGTVKKGDFGIIKALRKEYSSLLFKYSNNGLPTVTLAIISMHLYYLCNSDSRVPEELKNNILSFINEKAHTEKYYKIESWKTLFKNMLHEFNIDFMNFIKLSVELSNSLEYWIYDNRAHTVVLNDEYFVNWYLTNLLSSTNIRNFDFSKLNIDYPEIKYYIKSFGDCCLDKNRDFFISTEMMKIVDFYDNDSARLERFKTFENKHHKFSEYINKLKIEKVNDETEQIRNISFNKLAEEIKKDITHTLEQEWGYNKSISITGSERSFFVLLELFPDAINFEENILDCFRQSVLFDIKNSINSKKIYNDNEFENNIKLMLTKKLKYATGSVKNIIPYYYIHNQELKELYLNKCQNLKEFKSQLLNLETLVVDNGFSFNCIVNSVNIRKLNNNELSEQVEKYKRADGQYIFHGAFMPKEEITNIIHEKFVIITVIIQHQVNSSTDTVFEIFPYNKSEDEYI